MDRKDTKVEMPRTGLKVQFIPPLWARHWKQFGGRLSNNAEANALFYYYLLAMQAMQTEQDQLPLEGEPDYVAPFRTLYQRCALMYGANIETMGNYWDEVDAEIDRMSLNRVLQEGLPAITKLPAHLRLISSSTI